MIRARFYTIIIRKDALAAKWPGGVDGYKADIAFAEDDDWSQEDEHLITYAVSMGSDLDIMLKSLDPLTVYEKRHVTEKPSWTARLVGRVFGDRVAERLFGSPTSYEAMFFVDVAVASCGSPTRQCDWLRAHSDIGSVEFVQA
jgi:hypothetical protein